MLTMFPRLQVRKCPLDRLMVLMGVYNIACCIFFLISWVFDECLLSKCEDLSMYNSI